MKKILVINGPNLSMLGKRDPNKYGLKTLTEINNELSILAKSLDAIILFFQSNHEGEIIDFLQKDSSRKADGILINPGALIRYGFSLRQALIDIGKPVIEVHMTDINKTGVNKKVNILDDVRIEQVTGLKERSYFKGLNMLVDYLVKEGK